MKETKRNAQSTGKVILALFGLILMPVLIWVALGVAVNQKLRERSLQRAPAPTIGEILARVGLTIQAETATDQAVATKTFVQQSVSDIDKLLARAGLTVHEEAVPKHYSGLMYYPLALSRQIIPTGAKAIEV